jgi:hypothetical protein
LKAQADGQVALTNSFQALNAGYKAYVQDVDAMIAAKSSEAVEKAKKSSEGALALLYYYGQLAFEKHLTKLFWATKE